MTHIIEKSENKQCREKIPESVLFEVTVNIWAPGCQMAFLKT